MVQDNLKIVCLYERPTLTYAEVRYARDTSLSMPKSSPLFRLKKDYKNLSINTYTENLKTYLSKIQVSWADFDEAVGKLAEE